MTLQIYRNWVNKKVGRIALKKNLQNYGWYLSENLSGFGFFSNLVPEDEKAQMPLNLHQKPPRKMRVRKVDIKECCETPRT